MAGDTLIGTFDGVRVSFFGYDARLLEELGSTAFGVELASLLDIACVKLIAISQRGSKKDFVDLYHISASGVRVADAVAALPAKYPGVRYNPVHIARSLAYFDDAESEPDPVMLVPYAWDEVREFALAESSALIAEMIGG